MELLKVLEDGLNSADPVDHINQLRKTHTLRLPNGKHVLFGQYPMANVVHTKSGERYYLYPSKGGYTLTDFDFTRPHRQKSPCEIIGLLEKLI